MKATPNDTVAQLRKMYERDTLPGTACLLSSETVAQMFRQQDAVLDTLREVLTSGKPANKCDYCAKNSNNKVCRGIFCN
jgi:hypothetical protein